MEENRTEAMTQTANAEVTPAGADTVEKAAATETSVAAEGAVAEEESSGRETAVTEAPDPRARLGQAALRDHYARLQADSKALQAEFPGFVLEEALQDPRFLRMTAPGSGITVEDAYYALHHREIQKAGLEAAARAAEQKVASAVAANRARPKENGGGQQAGFAPNYRSMSRAQREALKERIYRAAARGEKLYPKDLWNE